MFDTCALSVFVSMRLSRFSEAFRLAGLIVRDSSCTTAWVASAEKVISTSSPLRCHVVAIDTGPVTVTPPPSDVLPDSNFISTSGLPTPRSSSESMSANRPVNTPGKNRPCPCTESPGKTSTRSLNVTSCVSGSRLAVTSRPA